MASRSWIVLLAALLAWTAPAAADDEKKPKDDKPFQVDNDPYPADFRKRVDAAVDSGVEYLMAKQTSNGHWPADGELTRYRQGVTALNTLAALVGGVKGDDPRIDAAFDAMRPMKLTKTYDVGVLLMALHARYSVLQELEALRIDKYGKREFKDPCKKKMSKEDKELMQKCVDFLVKHQHGGHWRYPEDGLDLSNTQYALLGLWAASRCGFKIPKNVWFDSLKWLLSIQERTGRSVKLYVNQVRGRYRVAWTEKARARGFRYRPENPVTGSMTTAGIAGLAICQEELWDSRKYTADMRKNTRRGIRDGLAWMQDNFDVTKNPGEPSGGWHFYYLYGAERAGVLSRMRFFGKYDWYWEGANYLLDAQRHDGAWIREHAHLDTAFAILFLKRSTRRTRNPAITPHH